MKKLSLTAVLLACVVGIVLAEAPEFAGLEKSMDSNTYERAGLRKLTMNERAALDEFIRDYVAAKQKVAASQAVDRAVKERKVQPPDVIESSIVGTYKGYGPKTVFHLANGETWRPTNDEFVSNLAIESPKVVIYRDFFGYKMFVEGATIVRVKRVQ